MVYARMGSMECFECGNVGQQDQVPVTLFPGSGLCCMSLLYGLGQRGHVVHTLMCLCLLINQGTLNYQSPGYIC